MHQIIKVRSFAYVLSTHTHLLRNSQTKQPSKDTSDVILTSQGRTQYDKERKNFRVRKAKLLSRLEFQDIKLINLIFYWL